MPQFRIRFDRPVNYLPDHPKGSRLGITELLVNAPTLAEAKAHALRVTIGPGVIVDDLPLPTPTVPAVEAPEPAAPENLRA